MASWERVFRHLWTPAATAHRAFTDAIAKRITLAISDSEARHRGEICFAVEAALNWRPLMNDLSARERGLQVFGQLRVWDTPENTGVLIYLLVADHDIEIIADRGIDQRVPADQWQRICRRVETRLRRGDFEEGIMIAIREIGELLETHFPPDPQQPRENRIPNRPLIR